MSNIFEAVNKSFKESDDYHGEGDIIKISVCPNIEDAPNVYERFKGCVRAIVESSTGETGCCYIKKERGLNTVVCYAHSSAKWVEYEGYFVAVDINSNYKESKQQDIIVKRLPDGGYDVHYGDKRTGLLSYDEMLGLVSSIAMPESRPCLQWLHSEEWHKNWEQQHEFDKKAEKLESWQKQLIVKAGSNEVCTTEQK